MQYFQISLVLLAAGVTATRAAGVANYTSYYDDSCTSGNTSTLGPLGACVAMALLPNIAVAVSNTTTLGANVHCSTQFFLDAGCTQWATDSLDFPRPRACFGQVSIEGNYVGVPYNDKARLSSTTYAKTVCPSAFHGY